MDSLEDGALITNVGGRGQTETTDETSRHIGNDVTVQVRHDEDHGLVVARVGNHLQAGVVEKLRVELDIGELLGDILSGGEEETVRHLHDGGLVDDTDPRLLDALGILETELQDALGSGLGDELDGLNNAIDDLVLNSGVFTLGVLTDEDSVDIVVGGLEAGDGAAGADVGEKVEGAAESKVKGDVALSDGSLEDSVRNSRITPGEAVVKDVQRGDP